MKYAISFFVCIAFLNAAIAQHRSDTTTITWEQGYLDIHHINTGRGVCTFFVLPDGTTMLVDAGDMDDRSFDSATGKNWPLTVTTPYPDNTRNSGEWIADYIHQVYPAVKQLDYALITHFHSDHMGVILPGTKRSQRGGYWLTGITQVGELIPIKTLIDRDYPDYSFPLDLKAFYHGKESIFLNYQSFIRSNIPYGLSAEHLKPGHTDQVVLRKQAAMYPSFAVRGIKRNGTIWCGRGTDTCNLFTADSVIDKRGKFNENPLSLAIRLSYGKFDYFTGGDNTGLQGYGLPAWFDVETPMSKVVGKVEVTTLDHHGNRDATNENFLSLLQPKVIVEQSWCSDQPGQEVLHRMIGDHLYAGEKHIFATNIQSSTRHMLGFWLANGYKSLFGHVIIRVLPGGSRFYVLVAETIKGKVVITKSFGPFDCN